MWEAKSAENLKEKFTDKLSNSEVLTRVTFSLGTSVWSHGESPHFTSRGCRISCRLGSTPGWSVYTRLRTDPRNRGSKMTLGSASRASLVVYQLGMPPTKISELVANFPNWNSLPLDALLCDTPSTVSDVCSSLRRTWKFETKIRRGMGIRVYLLRS